MADTLPPTPISVWAYNPSFPLAVLSTVLYCILFVTITYQTFVRYRTWYFTVMVVGTAMEVPAYALRCYSIKNPSNIAIYATSLSLTVLAPVLVAAGNYILLGRLVRQGPSVIPSSSSTTTTNHNPHHGDGARAGGAGAVICGLHGRFISRVFIVCDTVAFLVQCSGSAIATVNDWFGPQAQVGVWVLVGGLAFQLVAVMTFLGFLGRFQRIVGKAGILDGQAWGKVVWAVWVSSVLIVVRCIYRLVEFAEGIEGYSFTHEWVFYVFETVPVLIAIGVFCLWHPGAHLGPIDDKSLRSQRKRARLGSGVAEGGIEILVSVMMGERISAEPDTTLSVKPVVGNPIV
ncbi:hypothetical protein VTJ49DRAFT_7028 [Mycothermus thermophilus]|uniref:Uncharacterized protein n=1 Tax=Humicola insolens TaxID=85995 RepID=A0ABR3VJB8_HUMIN